MRIRIKSLDTAVWVAVAMAAVVLVIFAFWLFGGKSFTINNGTGERLGSATSPLTGQPCSDANRRPIAVMLASDPEARPLSGIADADMVFEMPVTPNGITRMMAVFQCHDPKEIGSVRSSRMDFIPLVQGLKAIYAHWGGERDALALLNGHVVDNVDALAYEGTVYYRKNNIPRPHNGFTTLDRIREQADKLGYTASSSLPPYLHAKAAPERNLGALVTEASIDWPQDMDVKFRYDSATNTYLRWRGGEPEMDRASNQQVRVGVVVILETDASFNYDQYISVRTTGKGAATIYQNGRRQTGLWKKQTASDPLTFVDTKGQPIPLAPGPIWVIINLPLPQP